METVKPTRSNAMDSAYRVESGDSLDFRRCGLSLGALDQTSMKITKSEGYHWPYSCEFDDCHRRYCKVHRLLWTECETIKKGWQGDRDIPRGTAVYYEDGDCPECERDYSHRKFEEEMKRHEP